MNNTTTTDYLLFRLYSPLASWGTIAVGEVRQSAVYPSKSAITGLIAAALGIKREEEHLHRQLCTGYGYAVQVHRPGVPLTDFHTAQVLKSRKGVKHTTRRQELKAVDPDDLGTILSYRTYYMDALYTVILWTAGQAPHSLAHLAHKLNYPEFVLYLGRKSCPPALPLEAQVVQAVNVKEALGKAFFYFNCLVNFDALQRKGKSGLYWEEGAETGIDSQHAYQERNVPLSRTRWQFDVHTVHYASLPGRKED